MQCNSTCKLVAPLRKTALAGHAHRVEACAWWIIAACLGDPRGLVGECVKPAECGRIDRLHVHGCSPSSPLHRRGRSLRGHRSTSRRSARARTLVTRVDTAGGQYRAAWLGKQNGRIVSGFPSAVSNHGWASRPPLFCRRVVMALVVSDAERSISTGSPSVGNPNAIGSGVKTARVPPCGATLAAFGSEHETSSAKPRSVACIR